MEAPGIGGAPAGGPQDGTPAAARFRAGGGQRPAPGRKAPGLVQLVCGGCRAGLPLSQVSGCLCCNECWLTSYP